jgi:type IV secretory pathway VirJ component
MTVARRIAVALTVCLAAAPIRAQVPSSLADLPLTEVPAAGSGHFFTVFLTGDGGWVALDQGVSAQLAAAGIPVVGFNQRTYLWSGKTPAQAAADLARIITAYHAKWHRDSVIVIGYSRGAGIAPFAVNRLPPALRASVKLVVLIGSERTAGFHFRMRDLLSSTPAPGDPPLMPEILAMGAMPLICFYGEDEKETICPDLAPPAVVVKMSGGHHLDGAYPEIGRRIVGMIR